MPHRDLTTIYNDERNRRAIIFQRDDGTFGFFEEYFSDDEYEHCWIPQFPASECRCDSLESVTREVYGRVPWLAN